MLVGVDQVVFRLGQRILVSLIAFVQQGVEFGDVIAMCSKCIAQLLEYSVG